MNGSLPLNNSSLQYNVNSFVVIDIIPISGYKEVITCPLLSSNSKTELQIHLIFSLNEDIYPCQNILNRFIYRPKLCN